MSLSPRLGKLVVPVLSAVALGLVLGAAAPASALSITGLTVTKNAANSASELVQSATSLHTRDSSVSVVSSTATSFTTRYAMVVGADVDNSPTLTETMTANYQITFQVNAAVGQAWVVSLATSRVGALTIAADGATGSARVTLGAVTGTKAGAGTLTGSLGLGAVPTITSGSDTNTPFNQTGNATISGLGSGAAQTITLNFRWNASARSTLQGANGDQAAVRMGLTSAALNFSADDYGGVGGRSLLGDGQFVSATLVPEQASFLLLAAGLIGLAIH